MFQSRINSICQLQEWTSTTAAHRAHLEPILLDNATLEQECADLRAQIAEIDAMSTPQQRRSFAVVKEPESPVAPVPKPRV